MSDILSVAITVIVSALIIGVLLALPVFLLWNAIPFLPPITFWTALWISLLFRVLFDSSTPSNSNRRTL